MKWRKFLQVILGRMYFTSQELNCAYKVYQLTLQWCIHFLEVAILDFPLVLLPPQTDDINYLASMWPGPTADGKKIFVDDCPIIFRKAIFVITLLLLH